ncbi:MAG: hypothetical protein IH934_02290 [Nanoarchaeota archaeon]|nr:hypothetical protein [Nanoarchaeota archaeon]
MRLIIPFVMLLLFPQLVFSATIYGTIYDLSLDKAKDIRVEINTEPRQFYISKNGSYAFNVPNGDYRVEARQYIGDLLKASVSENITIKDQGSYVLDLILFPSLEEDLLDDDINIIDPYPETKINFVILFILILFILVAIFVYIKNKKKISITEAEKKTKEEYEGNDLGQIVKIIKDEGGRTTQKHIRKQIPLSEAKISLMIDELEHKGTIEKIKKGRGNIIILKK